ncbi:BTAD domain-containing putative transcriptional regulator [Salipiger mangrovisoli]|uniref:Bacterial transcriptional activator domain-containing protein n=1 Tax=Salipiger mangrovisoli TaxID=2865933 RepID=A0ABR9XAQ2_9RHOB|nr:BTAD domain-containing putative transcriptional regulator [Salipiger mangrovisoli]MBE9640663.1 hypothetical protein [Salipiger mangrovisoli]
MSSIRVKLLPSLKILVDGSPVALRGAKNRAFMVFLAFKAGRSVQREYLAQLLWPDSEAKRARASLRQSLTQLRKALGDEMLRTTPEAVEVPDGMLGTDVAQLAAGLDEGLIDRDGLAMLQTLPELFSDIDSVGDEFGDWLRETRTRIQAEILTSVERLLSAATLDTQMQLALARAAVVLDDLNEVAIRAQITALAALNDHSAALRVYNQFYARLEDELGVEPSPETQSVAVRIKLIEAADAKLAPVAASPVAMPAPMTLVAVLPFQQLGPAPLPDYVILGLLEVITCKMAGFPAPAVISSNSTRHYLGAVPSTSEVRRDLGAHYVLTGTIQTRDGLALLTLQLCDCMTSHVRWAATREIPVAQLFEAGIGLAEDIARTLELSLNVAELERSRALPDEHLEPNHLVLQAKDRMFRLALPEFSEAKELLDRALRRGPNFAPAHALAAEWHAINVWQGWSDNLGRSRIALEEHARKAIYLAPNNGRAMAQWGHHLIALERDFDGALLLFERALQICPNDSEALIWTVPTLAHSGQAQRAVENGKKAFLLSPCDPFVFRNEHFLSLAHYASGEFGEAASLGLSCFRRAPAYGSNLRVTIASLVAGDRVGEARELAEHHNLVEPNFSLKKFRAAMGFRDPGQQDTYVQNLLSAGVTA